MAIFANARTERWKRLLKHGRELWAQLPGLLGAIKGAAEYEKLVMDRYGGDDPDPKYLEALRRMGPQLVAHLLIIILIVLANVVYFAERRRAPRET